MRHWRDASGDREQGLVRIGSLYQNEKPDTFRSNRNFSGLAWRAANDGRLLLWRRPSNPGRHCCAPAIGVTGTPNHRLLVAREGHSWTGYAWIRDRARQTNDVATQYGTILGRMKRRACLPCRLLPDWRGEAVHAARSRKNDDRTGLASRRLCRSDGHTTQATGQ